MDNTIHIDTISMELSILYFKVLPVKMSVKGFISATEMPFHLGLHCLPKYLFTVIENVKG